METKLFEVRDGKSFIPVICIKLRPANEAERYLAAMVGYGLREERQSEYVLYAKLKGGKMSSDPFSHDWAEVRTSRISHTHIIKHWDELTSGDVIDVEFILGEVEAPKVSQRLEKC